MSFKLLFLPSYLRCLKKLGDRERRAAGIVILALQRYFDSESMASDTPYMFDYQGRHYRLVFKKLQHDIWEAYVEQRTRVVTRFYKDGHYLVFAGSHDQVRQFLKEN